jgi:hypothetical protein
LVVCFLGLGYNNTKIMKKIHIKKIIYHIRHNYVTLNNIVIAAAFLIAASWVWASLAAMQRNYSLQRGIDYKKQELQLTQLQRDNLALKQNFYQTREYQELAVRDSLGYVFPGEKALVLPPNSQAAKDADTVTTTATIIRAPTSNLEQWVNFLFGGYSKSIADK